jgi:hypothetical protein
MRAVLRDSPVAQGTIFFSILFAAMKGGSFTEHDAEAMATTVDPVRKALTTKDTKDTRSWRELRARREQKPRLRIRQWPYRSMT